MNIVIATTTFTCFNTKMIKYGVIAININNFLPCFTILIAHWNTI